MKNGKENPPLEHFVQIKQQYKIIKEGDKKVNIHLVYPDYKLSGKDIMKSGGKFYAVLDNTTGLWSTDESLMFKIIDDDIRNYITDNFPKDAYGERRDKDGNKIVGSFLNDSESGRLISFNRWFSNLPQNHNYQSLDGKLTFLSEGVSPLDYRSKRLPYDIIKGEPKAYNTLMSTLYTEENRQKIEWCIGSILSGDSTLIDKILVIYGSPGSGKSTVLDIIKDLLFPGYYSVFKVDTLASGTDQFATSVFGSNPLLAVQDDGKLTRLEDPIINEIVSHKEIIINEKNRSRYTIKSRAMLIVATNDPVNLQDTKAGMVRRLLDVYPSGNKLPVSEYRSIVNQLTFEVPHIAYHCLSVYNELGKEFYVNYVPSKMILKTNYIQNFLLDNLEELTSAPYLTRNGLYIRFKQYCEESGLGYAPKRMVFSEQIKEYFEEYDEFKKIDGKSYRNVYTKLKMDKLLGLDKKPEKKEQSLDWLILSEQPSILDQTFAESPAQYANEEGNPIKRWCNVDTKLKDIDTKKLHWFKLPGEVIKIDFDKKGANGEKDLALNIIAAKGLPPTYAEVSKSGNGLHLYYYWKGGDVSELADMLDDDVEIKKSIGNLSHRRMLSKCNNLPLASLSSGLPKKKDEVSSTISKDVIETEKALISTVKKCLRKEVHKHTIENVEFIYKLLNDAYEGDVDYDLSLLKNDVYAFCLKSTNSKDRCLELFQKMHFEGKEREAKETQNEKPQDERFAFYDIESWENLFLLCWKFMGDHPVERMFNPTPEELVELFTYFDQNGVKYGGYNNRKYDDHMIVGRMSGMNVYQLNNLSRAIIANEKGASFREAYEFADFDIFDFISEKVSLKMWQIRYKQFHMELDFPWDKPLDEKYWDTAAKYCSNDVISTEAVFKNRRIDYTTRCIVSKLSGLKPINTNRQHITKYIYKGSKNIQHVYTDLSTGKQTLGQFVLNGSKSQLVSEREWKSTNNFINKFPSYVFDPYGVPIEECARQGMVDLNDPVAVNKFKRPKSIYMGIDPSEGGYVYSVQGMFDNVICYDVSGMHPASICAMDKFADNTVIYDELRRARLAVKNEDYDTAASIIGEEFRPFLNSQYKKALSEALKLILNSTYGICAASFDNPLRDPRDKDNIIAKRGALFMITLQKVLEEKGFKVVHIKTDSIKVVNPTEELEEFIMNFGKQYGYMFAVEHRFQKFCLVNKAVYVAKNYQPNKDGIYWEATGAQFAHPYVFKKLFSHENIGFDDLCEIKSVTSQMYIGFDQNDDLSKKYRFVGKTGIFCPIKKGHGGGELVRKVDDKYYAVTGTKGYEWLEAEEARHIPDSIDMAYFDKLADDAIKDISVYGNFERFAM